MDYRFTDAVELFDTDGRKTRLNPAWFQRLNKEQRIGTLLHLTLHAALLHPVRRGRRDEQVWNIAADIVVNDIIAQGCFQPPPETAQEPRYRDLSVEQVYSKLIGSMTQALKTPQGSLPNGKPQSDLSGGCTPSPSGSQDDMPQATRSTGREASHGSEEAPGSDTKATPSATSGLPNGAVAKAIQTLYPANRDLNEPNRPDRPNGRTEQKRLETHWKQAMLRAEAVERLSGKQRGDLPLGLQREIEHVLSPQLDWRTILWRFMAKTPNDYRGYDRRFIHRGLYLDQLEGESLTVYAAMDTSGSIDDMQLAQFLSEVKAVTSSYTSIQVLLFFVDAEVHGPYPVTKMSDIRCAQGGGGTDFAVFFEELESHLDPFDEALCVYLTDGDGHFPRKPPSLPVLWVVSGGYADDFPFGEVALLDY
jgi:predicted metal-dependent peptidase